MLEFVPFLVYFYVWIVLRGKWYLQQLEIAESKKKSLYNSVLVKNKIDLNCSIFSALGIFLKKEIKLI